MTRLPGRFAAAIFDFDETIIDLEPQHTYAHAMLCRDLNADYSRMPESFRQSSGRRIIDDVREMRAFFAWGAPALELLAIRQRHFDHACRNAELAPMPGVERMIRLLHERGVPMAVASSAVRDSIDTILRRLGLRDFFALIVDGSEVTHGKPDPEAYLVTARKLGVAPEDCIVFEDSHVGVVSAKRAGMFCIAVRNRAAQEFQDLSAADVVVDDMNEVVEEMTDLTGA